MFTLALPDAVRAAEESSAYSPSWCSTDADEKVYIRLYPAGVAYAFPYLAVTWMDGRPVEDRGPIANPDEPEGCPANPFVTRIVSINPVRNALNGHGGTYFSDVRRPDRLRVYGNALSGANDFRRRDFNRFCDMNSSVREELPDGVTVCRGRMQDEPDVYQWFAFFEIDLDVHSAPAHLSCRPLRLPIKICNSAQALGEDHRMTWKLWTSAVQPLPESELKQF